MNSPEPFLCTEPRIADSSAASTALAALGSTPDCSTKWATRVVLLKAVLMGLSAAGAAAAGLAAGAAAFLAGAAFLAAGAAALTAAFFAGAGAFFAVAMIVSSLVWIAIGPLQFAESLRDFRCENAQTDRGHVLPVPEASAWLRAKGHGAGRSGSFGGRAPVR